MATSFRDGIGRIAQFGFERRSGRVISLARAMLASLFLIAVWIDPSQPVFLASITYALLAAYAAISIAIAVATWNSWWLDARLAGPAHIVDIAMFSALVFLTAGYTSPFFVFFLFAMLSAAIRWGWRETAVTAAALTLLYLGAGLFVALSSQEEFELQRFIVRTGHLLILSALLIWFGVNLESARKTVEVDPLDSGTPSGAVYEALMEATANSARAEEILLLRNGGFDGSLLRWANGRAGSIDIEGSLLRPEGQGRVFLYDLEHNRALIYQPGRAPRFIPVSQYLHHERSGAAGLTAGLAIPVNHSSRPFTLFIQGIKGLSADHLRFGEELGSTLAESLRRWDLLQAMEEGGESRARLSLARDLHDSVVQFLAGAAFRVEGMIRNGPGEDVEDELKELKKLLMQEQVDLRTYIGLLQSDHETSLEIAAEELKSLAGKLASQWDVDCRFQSSGPNQMIPMRLHLDAQLLVREAFANAVRHGKARTIRLNVEADRSDLRISIIDDGEGFPPEDIAADTLRPRSLSERVSEAGGELSLESDVNGTSVTIVLPLRGSSS